MWANQKNSAHNYINTLKRYAKDVYRIENWKICFKECMLEYNKRLHATATAYIARVYITQFFDTEHYQHRFAVRCELAVPWTMKITLGRRRSWYTNPSFWNSLSQDIWDIFLSHCQSQSKYKKSFCRQVYNLWLLTPSLYDRALYYLRY